MKGKVIHEILKGNGNQFTVKEILQAHIKDGKEFEIYVREQFIKGSSKIAENRTSITMMKWIFGALATAITVFAAIK